MKRLMLATMAMAWLSGSAAAADLMTKAVPMPPPAPVADWSGAYIGVQGGFAWGKQSWDQASFGGFGGAGNINNILNNTTGDFSTLRPLFVDPGIGTGLNQNGGLFGVFAGYQKQLRGSGWVVGGEVDVNWASITGSASASLVSPGEQVSQFRFAPQVSTGTATVAPVTAPVTGTATIAPVTVTIPGQTITSTGSTAPFTFTLPGQTVTVAGQTITLPDQTVTVPGGTFTTFSPGVPPLIPPLPTGTVTIPAQTITIPGQTVVVAGQTITLPDQTVTIPAQTITSTGKTAPVAVTVPGQTAPVTGTAAVPGQIAPVTVTSTNALLQRRSFDVDVTRTASVDTKIDQLASARGKIGYAFGQNFMLFGTGGLALAHAVTTATSTESFTLPVGTGGSTTFNLSNSVSGGATLFGWAAGAGFDWKFLDDGNSGIIFGIQYLHSDFPKHTLGLADANSSVNFVNARQSVDAVTGRISWLIH